MTTVSLEHITKQYGSGAPAVDDLSFTINDGEFFTLLGPSGCGKSTTLRMIAGFITPSQGTIAFNDRNVTSQPPHRRDTGMVFQNYALFPHMDVNTNVEYGLKMRKIASTDRDQRVAAALAAVGMEAYGDRRIDQLSGGQQQRVALARALVITPSVLLLDEPLSNLDAKLRDETRTQIRQIQQQSGTTSVYVTHDQSEAMAMSDRIAVLSEGKLHQLGAPREIYRRPATSFVAKFIGRSNVLEGVVAEVAAQWVSVQLSDGAVVRAPRTAGSYAAEVSVGDEVAISLRPESFTIEGRADAASDRGEGVVQGRVTLIEYTGPTCLVNVEIAGVDCMVTIPDTDDLPQIGDHVLLRPDPARAWVVAR